MLQTADVFKYAKCKNTKHMPEVDNMKLNMNKSSHEFS